MAYARGDYQSAIRAARRVLADSPKDQNALRLYARAAASAGYDEQAIDQFGRLGPPAMQPEDLYLLGMVLERNAQRTAAVQLWEQARGRSPDDPKLWYALARAYTASDRLADAQLLAEKLTGRSDWSAQGRAIEMWVAHESGDSRGVIAAYDELSRLDTHKRPDLFLAPKDAIKIAGRAYLALSEPEPAANLLRGEEDPEARWLLSRAELQRGDASRALELLSSVDPRAERMAGPYPEPAPFIGAPQCANCHPSIYRDQQSSRHGQTFRRRARLNSMKWPAEAIPDPARPEIAHHFEQDGAGVKFTSLTEGKSLSAIVEYVLGSGDRGATPIGPDEGGQWRELRLSSYQAGAVWDITTGHPRLPEDPDHFLGQELSPDAVRRCLDCHTSHPFHARDEAGPLATERGIGCERCHGPGGHHVIAVDAGFPDLAIIRPKLAPVREVDGLCAKCHSPRGVVVRPEDKTAIRFQSSTLTWSRCYTESQGALGCLSCHDPHRNASTEPAYYDAKCLTCHSKAPPPARSESDHARPIVLSESMARTECPVNPKSGCVGCHMPTIPEILPHTAFTDHWIRVRNEMGENKAPP
jgi:tetratricopeptide (TPR) repeat protein